MNNPTPIRMALSRKGMRQPHARNCSSGSADTAAKLPAASRLPADPIWGQLPKKPRLPGGVLHNQQGRPAPLATDPYTLEDPQYDEQYRGQDPDGLVGRQNAYQEGRDAHDQERQNQYSLAAELVAVVAEDYSPYGSKEEAYSECGEGHQRASERHLARKEQLVEDHGSRQPVEEEVVPLDHGPHKGRNAYLPDRGYLPQVFTADVSRCAQVSTPPYYPARPRSPVGPGLYHHRPVDQYERDPLREAFGVVVGGPVRDLSWVEHDQVRGVPRREDAALAQLKPLGRERGHLPDRLLEAQQSLLPHVGGKDVREGAIEAGVRLFGPIVEAVGGDQGAVPLYHLLHVGLSHVEEHNGDPPVLLQEQVHHAVRGVYPPRLAYLGDVIALQGRSVVVHTH